MAEPWESFPDVEPAAGQVASWEELPDIEPVPTSAQPVDAFKAKVGLSDPLAPAVSRYRQQQLEREELVRSGFRFAADPGADPELVDARVANHFGVSVDTVKASRKDWLDGYAKAANDPKTWIERNPAAARLLFEHPERADIVVNDKPANLALQAFHKVLDWTYDFGIKPLSGNPEDVAAFETEKAAQLAGRAQRDAPKPTEERDNAEAQAIRERGDPLEMAAQRAKESRAQLEVSRMWARRLRAKALGQNTEQLDADIRDAEERGRALYLGEKGWTQVLSEGWATAQSTLAVVDQSLADAGTAGALLGTGAAVGTMAITKNPAAAGRAFVAGSSLGLKLGGASGAASASFELELGESYKGFLQLRTDAGKQLTEEEARGAALIAASLKTGIELAEMTLIMKALGPAGAAFEGGGIAAVQEALATNPGFRALATRAAKAWVGEGVEEAAQGATNDAIGYLAKVKAAGGQQQKGPVFGTLEERGADLVGGLLGGVVFGAGGLAVSTSTYAVKQGLDARAVQTSARLAELASTPALQEMAGDVASTVKAMTGEAGDEVAFAWVDASAFRRLFQADKEAESKIEELMGPEGKKALDAADFTGGKLAVPLEQYIEKWGKDELAKKLADDTAVRSDRPTPNEAREQQAADEAFAAKLAEEMKAVDEDGGETAAIESPTVARFRELELQLAETGRMTREEARTSLQPLKQGFLALAKRFGQKSEDLFENVRIVLDDGTRGLAVEQRTAAASRLLSEELRAGKLDTRQAASRLFIDETVTGLYNIDGFNALLEEEPAASVATLTLTDIKPVNDAEQGGHDTANALLAYVAPAVAAVDPRAARKGTSFVIRGGAAELQRALEGVQALLPQGMQVRGAVGPTVKDAQAAMDTAIDAERASGKGTLPANRENTLADLSKLPELEQQFQAARAAREQQEAQGQRRPLRVDVTPGMLASTAALGSEKYFSRAYQDKVVPGVLSGIGWNAIPRKAFVASIDIKGLKAINTLSEQLFGKDDKRLGDLLLKTFMETGVRNDGSDFDFAHLSGDEFAAQADSQEELQAWLDDLAERLTKFTIPVDHPLAGSKTLSVAFRGAVGKGTYGNADRALNAAKRREKAAGTGGLGAGEGPRADGRVPGEVSGLPAEAGRAGSREALQRSAGSPRRRRRRGSAAQFFVAPQGQTPADNGSGNPGDGGRVREEVPGQDVAFDPAELDAQNAADAAATAAVEQLIAERIARGAERSEERLAIEQGFNTAEALTGFRAALARLRTNAAERRAAGEAFAKWVENLGPQPKDSPALRDVAKLALEHNVVDPDNGLTAIINEGNSKPSIDKDLRRGPKKMARSVYEQELQRTQREAFARNVQGKVTLKQDERGYFQGIDEGTNRVLRIVLNEKADRSTFLHESAHAFLDLLQQLARRAEAPQSVRDDFAAALKWLGVPSLEGLTEAEWTAAQERWAEAFEVYLSKGEYPSARLAGPFRRFRLWFGQMGKRLAALTQPTPELEQLFARLLATDAEIDSVQKSMGFRALPRHLLGLSVAAYNEHLDKLAQATSHAQKLADFRIAEEQLRTTERWWKDEVRQLEKEARVEYEALPARQAQLILQGKPAGDFLGINEPLLRAAVEAWVGKEEAKKFRLSASGIHPDEVAEAYGHALGFGTGRDMIQAVVSLPSEEDFVSARADQQMAERHPGVLEERLQLRELVAKGLHGEMTKDFALTEWRALTAKTRAPKTMPTAASLKRAAEIIAKGRPAGHLATHAALVAERKASDGAAKAALAGDFELASALKLKQLLNMYLYDALREAAEDVKRVEKLADKLSTLAARKRLGKGHPTYRDAVELLLGEFGFEAKRESLKGSLDALLLGAERLMQDNADTVAFDRARVVDRADTLNGKSWKELPVEDLLHVERALANIEAAARNRATIQLEQRRIDKETAVAELLADAEKLPLRPQEPTQEAETTAQRWGRRWNRFDGGTLKPETLARFIAGTHDTAAFIKSAAYRYLVEPMQQAKAREQDLYRTHIAPLVEAFNAIPEVTQQRQMERIDGRKLFPGHIDEKLPQRRFEVLMMLLHSGNASNLQRLTEGRGITEAELRNAAVEVGVTREEYDWLQTVWDTAEGLKPLAFDLEEADSGVRPEAIVSQPFATPFGVLRGGYFPAVYDRITRAGMEQEASLAGLQDKSYTRPGTSHSFLKQRSEGFTDIISLSPASISRHFTQVVHDVAYRQAVKSVGTLILDPRVQAALRERLGSGRAQQFLDWVRDVAQMRAGQMADDVSGLRTLASMVRGNIVTAVLGYKLPNALEDLTSNLASAMSATDLKSRYLAAGMSEALAGGRAAALEKSGELRARADQVQRELAKQVRGLTETGLTRVLSRGPLGWYKDHAFVFAETVDRFTSTSIWLGAYRQALAGEMGDADAVRFADATVRQALISHSPVDLSALMRNKGVVGHMLMFHGAFNHFWNQYRQQGAAAAAGGVVRASARAAGLTVSLFVVGALARGKGPDKDEPLEEWLFRSLALEGVMQLLPGLGEVGNVLAAAQRGKASTPRNNSLVGVAGGITDAAVKAAESGEPAKVGKLLGQLAGPVSGFPVSGPAQSLGPVLEWVFTDGSDWRNPGDALSDVVYGRKKDQPANPVQVVTDAVAGPR